MQGICSSRTTRCGTSCSRGRQPRTSGGSWARTSGVERATRSSVSASALSTRSGCHFSSAVWAALETLEKSRVNIPNDFTVTCDSYILYFIEFKVCFTIIFFKYFTIGEKSVLRSTKRGCHSSSLDEKILDLPRAAAALS